jgi:hypothetical protein
MTPISKSPFIHWLLGRESWRVEYADGKLSVRMRYSTAVDYSEIFKSRGIVFDPA